MILELKGYKLYDEIDAEEFIKSNNLPNEPISYSDEKEGNIHMYKDWEIHKIIVVTNETGKALSLGFWKYITIGKII